jgi:hypothetical protein
MPVQIPTINQPTTASVNNIDQGKLNVGDTNTGDYNLRNVAIAGMLKRCYEIVRYDLLYLVEPVVVPASNDVSLLFRFQTSNFFSQCVGTQQGKKIE